MSDEAVTPEVSVEETTTVAETTVEAPAEPQVTPETQVEDELPEWAREKLKKANDEAAKYRVRAKETEEKVRQEVTSEYETKLSALSDEKAAIEADLHAARLDYMRLRAALAAGIPGESAVEFAELLKGETEEEIAAHAEKVKSLMGMQRPVVHDRSRGLGTGSSSPASDFGAFIMSHLTK